MSCAAVVIVGGNIPFPTCHQSSVWLLAMAIESSPKRIQHSGGSPDFDHTAMSSVVDWQPDGMQIPSLGQGEQIHPNLYPRMPTTVHDLTGSTPTTVVLLRGLHYKPRSTMFLNILGSLGCIRICKSPALLSPGMWIPIWESNTFQKMFVQKAPFQRFQGEHV